VQVTEEAGGTVHVNAKRASFAAAKKEEGSQLQKLGDGLGSQVRLSPALEDPIWQIFVLAWGTGEWVDRI
jgi:hypothetical protein